MSVNPEVVFLESAWSSANQNSTNAIQSNLYRLAISGPHAQVFAIAGIEGRFRPAKVDTVTGEHFDVVSIHAGDLDKIVIAAVDWLVFVVGAHDVLIISRPGSSCTSLVRSLHRCTFTIQVPAIAADHAFPAKNEARALSLFLACFYCAASIFSTPG